MTREEAKKEIRIDFVVGRIKDNVDEIIDKVFDYFEQQCKNCKFNGNNNGESWQEGYNQARKDIEAMNCFNCKHLSKGSQGGSMFELHCEYFGDCKNKYSLKNYYEPRDDK